MSTVTPKSTAITRPSAGAITAPGAHDPLAAALTGYDRAKYNFATPITVLDRVPAMHRVSVRVVTINPATETYPIPGGDKVGLGKTALDKIAAAAGISWIPERSGQVDAWNEPHRAKYRATCTIKDFDGRQHTVYAEKEVDLRGEPSWPESQLGSDAREFLRIAAKKQRDPWPQIYQQRQHIHSMAESKAKLRCIRAAIGLPVSMLPADAAKPFVVLALVPDLDTSDPEIKRMVAASLLGSQEALYGPQRLAVGLQTPLQDDPEAIDVSDMEVEEPTDPAIAGQQELPLEPEPELPPEEPAVPPCGLPVTEQILSQVPSNDEPRYRHLSAVMAWCKHCEHQLGANRAQAIFQKLGAGFDPLAAPIPELIGLVAAIKAEVGGGK